MGAGSFLHRGKLSKLREANEDAAEITTFNESYKKKIAADFHSDYTEITYLMTLNFVDK